MSEFDPFTLFDIDENSNIDELLRERTSEEKIKPKRKPLALFLTITTIVLLVVLSGSYFLYLILDYNGTLPEEVITLLGPTRIDIESEPIEEYDSYSVDEDDSFSNEDLTVGFSADLDDLDVTLDRASIWAGDDEKPKKGEEYLLLEWNVLNNTEENFNLSKLDFTVDVDGKSIKEADVSYKDTLEKKKIDSGEDVNGGIVYEVPEDWEECEITVSRDSSSASFYITPDDLD